MTSATTTGQDGTALPGHTGQLPGSLLDHVLRQSFGLEGYVQHPLGGEVDQNVRITGDQAFNFIGSAAFSGAAGQLRAEYSGGNAFVMGDVDGNGVADFVIRLDNLPIVTSSDFLL